MSAFFTLAQLNGLVKEALKENFPDLIWVVAEISELKINRNGHCYIELIQKGEHDNLEAKVNATIWASTYRILRPYFETATNQSLQAGIKVLLHVAVSFHELYGFSLNIQDIDPNYTLGDLAQKRQAIIKQLQSEGIFDMNKELVEPMIIQRIAIVSSPTAAGFEDFCTHLDMNSYGYAYRYKLFPAIMQGKDTETSIINALELIYAQQNNFDVVVIIRGGGAQSDLQSFNTYNLAANIAQFPLPVLTGIGHEQDETIPDLVAHKSLKTPTAVANYIIDKMSDFESHINQLYIYLADLVTDKLNDEQLKVQRYAGNIGLVAQKILHRSSQQLAAFHYAYGKHVQQFLFAKVNEVENYKKQCNQLAAKIQFTSNAILVNTQIVFKQKLARFINLKEQQLIVNEKIVKHYLPENILKKGFSVTLVNGKAIKSESEVNAGDEIKTLLYLGEITSVVKQK
jgi:exodeoxyribonuclease VII large subunit